MNQAPRLATFVSSSNEAQQVLANNNFADHDLLCSGMSTDLIASAVFLSYRYNDPPYDGIVLHLHSPNLPQ
jgi:hypothetical protein